MTGEDDAVLVDEDWNGEAELLDAPRKLTNLLRCDACARYSDARAASVSLLP